MCNKKRGVLPSLFVMRNTLASLCEGGTGCRKSLSLRASPQGRGSTPPAVLRSHSLASPFGRGGRAQRGRRGQTMTIPALSVTCGDSSPKERAKGLHSSTECLHVIRFGRGRAVRPYNRLPYLRLILALSFRASDRRHWCGNPSPFLCLRRPLAATSLCRFAAKARFDNRLKPQG